MGKSQGCVARAFSVATAMRKKADDSSVGKYERHGQEQWQLDGSALPLLSGSFSKYM